MTMNKLLFYFLIILNISCNNSTSDSDNKDLKDIQTNNMDLINNGEKNSNYDVIAKGVVVSIEPVPNSDKASFEIKVSFLTKENIQIHTTSIVSIDIFKSYKGDYVLLKYSSKNPKEIEIIDFITKNGDSIKQIEHPLEINDLITINKLKSIDTIETYLTKKSPNWFYHSRASDQTGYHVWINNSLKTSIGVSWGWGELRYEENEKLYSKLLTTYENFELIKSDTNEADSIYKFESNEFRITYQLITNGTSENSIITVSSKE